MTAEELLICERCGKDSEEDSTVRERACGYDMDLYGKERLEVVCDSCEHEHCMDI